MIDKEPYRERNSVEGEDRIDMAFFLLRRNGRIILGMVLIAAIGLWIYNASTSTRDPTSAGTWSKKLGQYLPATDIDSEPTSIENDGKDSEEIKEETSNRILKVNQFLSSATVDEKLDETLDIRDIWMKNELPVAYILVWRRAKIARNLIESDVDDQTRIFAYNEYIESILTLDALNCQGKLGVPGIREALKEVATMFEDFPDNVIQSKASLAHVLEPAHDYLETKDLSHIERLWKPFEEHSDKVMLDPQSSVRLVKLIADLYARSNYSSSFREPGLRISKMMGQSTDPTILDAAEKLKEQIYFAEMELYSLAERIEGGNLEARNDVRQFFEGLDVNPSSRIEIYQIAIDVVAQYKELGLSDDATALTNWLNDINAKNSDEENRIKVAEAVTELRR